MVGVSIHWELLRSFAPDDVLHRAHRAASDAGLLAHEFGDLILVRGGIPSTRSMLTDTARTGTARTGTATGLSDVLHLER